MRTSRLPAIVLTACALGLCLHGGFPYVRDHHHSQTVWLALARLRPCRPGHDPGPGDVTRGSQIPERAGAVPVAADVRPETGEPVRGPALARPTRRGALRRRVDGHRTDQSFQLGNTGTAIGAGLEPCADLGCGERAACDCIADRRAADAEAGANDRTRADNAFAGT